MPPIGTFTWEASAHLSQTYQEGPNNTDDSIADDVLQRSAIQSLPSDNLQTDPSGPSFATNLQAASIVPPRAIRSSTIKTFRPGAIASACISMFISRCFLVL